MGCIWWCLRAHVMRCDAIYVLNTRVTRQAGSCHYNRVPQRATKRCSYQCSGIIQTLARHIVCRKCCAIAYCAKLSTLGAMLGTLFPVMNTTAPSGTTRASLLVYSPARHKHTHTCAPRCGTMPPESVRPA